jgi:hypothetical protein
MTPLLTAAAPLEVGRGRFRETNGGHRCNTWQNHGSAGWECAHGHVLARDDAIAALMRAERSLVPAAGVSASVPSAAGDDQVAPKGAATTSLVQEQMA